MERCPSPAFKTSWGQLPSTPCNMRWLGERAKVETLLPGFAAALPSEANPESLKHMLHATIQGRWPPQFSARKGSRRCPRVCKHRGDTSVHRLAHPAKHVHAETDPHKPQTPKQLGTRALNPSIRARNPLASLWAACVLRCGSGLPPSELAAPMPWLGYGSQCLEFRV